MRVASVAADAHDKSGAPRVKCPGCGTLCLFAPANKWRPFCSERCRNLDLGAWASERYRLNGGPPDAAEGADAPAPS
jgi:uncharacterized protein